MRELRLVDAGELLPLARRLVERLEDLGRSPACLVPAAKRPSSASSVGACSGAAAEHLAVGRDRRVEIAEARLVDLAEAVLELEDLVGRLADLGLAREDLDELAPALGHA